MTRSFFQRIFLGMAGLALLPVAGLAADQTFEGSIVLFDKGGSK